MSNPSKQFRQGAILRLVAEQELATQSELADALRAEGIEAVQTTVSRDVAELALIKVRGASGRLVYAAPGAAAGDRTDALVAALRRWARTLDAGGNLLVVTTPSGFANALAEEIDRIGHPSLVGTIAGDNTIFVAVRDGVSAAALRDELSGALMEGAA